VYCVFNDTKEAKMKTREIIDANIVAIGFVAGKSVRGKGLQIFTPVKSVDHAYDFGSEGLDAERAEKAFSKIEGERLVFLLSDNGSDYTEVSEAEFRANFVGKKSASIKRLGELIGYIPVSKYDADLVSQKQLVEDLYALWGHKVGSDWLDCSYYDFDDVMSFNKENRGTYYNGDYSLVHGNTICQDEGDCEKIDGRLDYYSESVVDDFWMDGLDSEKCYLKELDPEESICVYHRKGKDWYVGYSMSEEEIYLTYKTEDGDLAEEEYFKILLWKENPEILQKIVEVVKGWKLDCDVKGYINIQLADDEDRYVDRIVNLGLFDAFYGVEYRYEAAYELCDLVDYKAINSARIDIPRAVQNAYDKWLQTNVVGKENDDGRYEEFKSLVSDIGYELTETLVPGTNYTQTCVKYKTEEYHFFLGELYSSDSAEAFFRKVQLALQRRLLERMEQSVLMEKAMKVFVGLEDSYTAGNCKSGTQAFCERNHIDTNVIGGVRGDELLKLEVSNFTKRAVLAAIAREGGVA